MTKNSKKAVFWTILITVFGVVIGFLGELMPDNLKNSVEAWTVAHAGMPYLKVWIIVTTTVVCIFIYLVWKETLQKDKEEPYAGSASRTVTQGSKSIYIEKNEGDITIS